MQKGLLLVLFVLLLALVTCGCATQPGGPAPAPATPVPTVPPASSAVPTMAPPASPVGSWDLVSMTLVDAGGGSFAWNPPSAPITAVFGSDGRVGGFGGCNDYGGVYTTAGSSIAVTDVISTLKSCGDVLDAQERAFLAILGASSTFENTGTMLTILTGSSPPGKLVFRAGPAEAAPVPEAIAGDWSLIQMTKDGDAITLVAGSRPAAHFAADGNLSGTGGCNRYSGRYVLPVTGSISSGSLSIGPLATTMMACAGPVMTQEDTYLGILGNAASWEVDSTSGTLTLRENTTVENSLVYTKIP